jgi:hypothetical protein
MLGDAEVIMAADDDRDDSVEIQPIERRKAPRGPIPGLAVTVLEGAPLEGERFDVVEFGVESFFLKGELAAKAEPKQTYKLEITYNEQAAEGRAECVRIESEGRVGAVLRLLSGEKQARELLESVLKPSGIPLGQH